MPKVQNPLLSTEAWGQLAGILYRRGTYGPIVSRRSISAVHRTPSQTMRRGTFASASSAWRNLSPASRLAWEGYATYPTTGRAKYIGNYIRLAPTGLKPPDFPTQQPPTRLFDLQLTIQGMPGRPAYLVTWNWDGNPDCFVRIPLLQTWSSRNSPKPSKLTGDAWTDVTWRQLTDPIPYESPTLWVRVELVNYTTGDLIESHLLKATR